MAAFTMSHFHQLSHFHQFHLPSAKPSFKRPNKLAQPQFGKKSHQSLFLHIFHEKFSVDRQRHEFCRSVDKKKNS